MFENRIIQANKQIKYQCLKTNKVIRLQTGHIETCLQIVFFFRSENSNVCHVNLQLPSSLKC